MNDHLAKPIDVKELFKVLGRWVQVPEGRQSSMSRIVEGPEAVAEEIASLPALPGVDTRSGLARVGGKVSVYRKILQQFARSQADAPARIRNALMRGDRETAEREAHTVKGVAGNIGADKVQELAKALEAAIREEADTDGLITELDRAVSKLVESLASLTVKQATAEEARPNMEASELLPKLDELQTLLEAYDGEAVEVISEIASQTAHTSLAQSIRELAERIDDFDFDLALERLKALRAVIRSQPSGSAALT